MVIEARSEKFRRLGDALAAASFADPERGENAQTPAFAELQQVFASQEDLLADLGKFGASTDSCESMWVGMGLYPDMVTALQKGSVPPRFNSVLMAFESLAELCQARYDHAVTELAEFHSRSELADKMRPGNPLRGVAEHVRSLSPNHGFRQLLSELAPNEAALAENISISKRVGDAAKAVADMLESTRQGLGLERTGKKP